MPSPPSDHCDFVIDALGITSAVCETFIPCHLLLSTDFCVGEGDLLNRIGGFVRQTKTTHKSAPTVGNGNMLRAVPSIKS
jgi:hypothetical protein